MIEYEVLEDQNKVVGTINHCENDAIAYIKKRAPLINWDTIEGVKLKKSYTSIVPCNPGDVFNVDDGKTKARLRVTAKYHKDYDKAVEKAKQVLLNIGECAKKM